MGKLKLNTEEKVILQDVLEYELKELRNEISNTENWEFKQGLKKKEAVVKKVLAALAKGQSDASIDVEP